MENNNLLEIRNLQTYFFVRGRTAKAVDDVSLTIQPGQTLGLVGESGCGKSVTAHSIIQLIPDPPVKLWVGRYSLKATIFWNIPKAECAKFVATGFP